MSKIKIKNLSVAVEGKEVLSSVSLDVDSSQIHVLVGPNGTGKSTLLGAIIGNPAYQVTSGDILLDGESILDLSTEERAKKGLFLAFQHPVELPGVSMVNFLRTSYRSVVDPEIKISAFSKLLKEKMKFLNMNTAFRGRHVNSGFSGGEKKRSELLQMLLLEPKIALLDEIDSGVDVDAIKLISKSINELREKETGFLLISHQNVLLKYLDVDKVTILKEGKVAKTGGPELLQKIEEQGFDHD